MPTIEVSDETYRMILRDIIIMSRQPSRRPQPWQYSRNGASISLPHGTELRGRQMRNGSMAIAKIVDGKWMQGNNAMTSPSAAAVTITGSQENGWEFWSAKLPGTNHWRKLSELRR